MIQQASCTEASFLQGHIGIREEKVKWAKMLVSGSLCCGVGVHALDIFSAPPKKLPFLYDALFVTISFANLLPAAVYLNFKQYQIREQTYPKQSKDE